MRFLRLIVGTCAVLACGCASAPSAPTSPSPSLTKTTPLILEKNEGEQRTWRGYPGHPKPGSTFFLKVDPANGGSSRLVFGTEDMPPGDEISTHKHPGADEILFLQTGTARVHLGNAVRVVHAGSTVFIPAGTWISVSSLGPDTIHLAFIFSAPGFEGFMRAESVRTGEKNTPVSKADDDRIQREHANDVIYK
jgi:quercetin dioxygenase-like cupin family protein